MSVNEVLADIREMTVQLEGLDLHEGDTPCLAAVRNLMRRWIERKSETLRARGTGGGGMSQGSSITQASSSPPQRV